LKFRVKAGSPDPVMTRHGWPTACVAGRASALCTSSTAAIDATPATATARSAKEVERIPLFMLSSFLVSACGGGSS
jgi:hypothetical protein